jgi:hypothetical protein
MFLHYIWIDFKNEMNPKPDIPQKFVDKMNNCKRVNPGFEVLVWNGPLCRQLLVEKYPDHVDLYDSLPYPIMKCDMIRFFILHQYGGLYMDFDRTCLKPFDNLLRDDPDVIVPLFRYGPFHVYNNDFIYSKPGSGFMKQCMDSIQVSKLPTHSLKVLATAGPIFLTRQVWGYDGPERIVGLDKEINGCNICSCANDISEQFSFGDFSSTSWTGKLDNFGRFLVCNGYEIIITLLVLTIIFFVVKKVK